MFLDGQGSWYGLIKVYDEETNHAVDKDWFKYWDHNNMMVVVVSGKS